MSESSDIHTNLGELFGYNNLHVHMSKVLGAGSYGNVVKATLDHHLPCAAKILHTIFFRSDDPGAVGFAARFDQECAILRELKHPCIVQFLGVAHNPTNNRPILLMELMEESLTGFLEHSTTSLPYHIQVNITHDIALALVYLHSNHIIHRDLSSNNVLLNSGCRAKVTDFGMSKIVDAFPRMIRSKLTRCPGTPAFMPPEALRANPQYSDKLDTFSLGVLMIQIITRTYPEPTDATIVKEDTSSPTGEKIIPIPELERRKSDVDKVPSTHALQPIALHCLKDKDSKRPTAAQLCQRLEQLKAAQAYTASEAENRRPSLEQNGEIARLQARMRQLATEKELLATEKEQQQQMMVREMEELRRQLQTSQTAPAQSVVRSDSRPDERALYDAAKRGDVSAVRRLIATHVNVDCTYQDGWTPLMTASFEGHVDIVRLLVKAKAQLNIQTETNGSTALHLATQQGKVEVVRVLMEAKALVNVEKKDGATPLFTASQYGHTEIVNILIGNGADMNLARKTGSTPLYIASQEGHSDVVNILTRNKADTNLANNDGATPLFIASQKGHSDIVHILKRSGADINMTSDNGATPLFIASQEGHGDVVNVLKRNGADINQTRNDGSTPLFIASQKGHSDVVNVLSNGADVNLARNDGATPLYIASHNGHYDVVNILIKRGADIHLPFKGMKPIDAARSYRHCEVVRLLEKRSSYKHT